MGKVKPRYAIIKADKLHLLVPAVDMTLQDGVWCCIGGPFYDGDMRQWCQAITRPTPTFAMEPAREKVSRTGR